jgi:hypothetical protein
MIVLSRQMRELLQVQTQLRTLARALSQAQVQCFQEAVAASIMEMFLHVVSQETCDSYPPIGSHRG